MAVNRKPEWQVDVKGLNKVYGAGVAVNRKPLEIAHPGVCNFLGNRKLPLEIANPHV